MGCEPRVDRCLDACPFALVLLLDLGLRFAQGGGYYHCAMLTRLCCLLALTSACAIILNGSVAFPQTTTRPDPVIDFNAKFETVLAQHGVVGGGFTFVHGVKEDTFTYGEARRETHQPVDAATAFNWASITKTFTAIAILQLRDRGRLSLDDPAVRYVPEIAEVHDAYGPIESVTIRQLLSHSAGFRNPTWPWDCDEQANCDWQPFEPTRWSQVAAMLLYTHIAFAPGSRWSYSNLGYVFLGQIIERLSGDDFEVYIDKNILKPLGMTRAISIARLIFSSRTYRPATCAQAPSSRRSRSTSTPASPLRTAG